MGTCACGEEELVRTGSLMCPLEDEARGRVSFRDDRSSNFLDGAGDEAVGVVDVTADSLSLELEIIRSLHGAPRRAKEGSKSLLIMVYFPRRIVLIG